MSKSIPSDYPKAVISYMPRLLPDELLYSFMGRLVACNALGDPRAYLKLLFGTKDIIPSIDLPTSLASLLSRLGFLSPLDSADEIIDRCTVYPYHRPFLASERHEAVRQILLHGGGKGLKTLLGRVANRFGANPPLQYCLACNIEDIACYGVRYWRRMHQLPGVTSCTSHGTDLIVYQWPSTSTDRQRLHLVPCSPARQSCSVRSSPRQLWFAELSRDLLYAGLPVLCLQQRQLVYERAVAALGLCSNAGRINHEALALAVRSYHEDFHGFPHRDRLLSTALHPLGWLRTLFDRPSRALHPVCHLLLIDFLFKKIEGFKQALQETGLVGTPHADARDVSAADGVSRESNEKRVSLLTNAAVSCREVARILDVSVTTVVSQRRAMGIPIAERRKSLTAAKLAAITKSLAEGLPAETIARRYRVSTATVYRLRVESKGLLNTHMRIREERERRRRRRRWMGALERHPDVGVSETRSTDNATYTWLYRHDRIWLQEMCKPTRSSRKTVPRVDWATRDVELCARLEQLASDLRLRHDRPRISKTLLLRSAGEAMVRANLQKLPKLKASLDTMVETPLAFQMFRIDRAIGQLAAQALPVVPWRIQRSAGLRKWTKTLRLHADRTASGTTHELRVESRS